MKLSVILPNCMEVAAITQPWEKSMSGREIASVARLADDLGFQSAFVSEHFFFPRAHVALSGEHALHATTALGFIAGATDRIRLGSLITILPLQHPVVAAKSWATLDWMSGGRAIAGIGVGWLRDEFDVIGVPFTQRGRRTDEYLEAIGELWSSEDPSYAGDFVSFRDIAFAPKPIQQPRIPLWFGGDSRPALRRVARFGDGWCPMMTPPEKIPHRLAHIASQPEWVERPLDVFFTDAWTNIGEAHAVLDNPLARGSTNAQQIIDRCGYLAELGVTETWIAPPPLSGLEAYLDHLRWVAAEIMPACSDGALAAR
ncbi:MAG TPA: TIGR03619 family F420-dependent LLM class oxidoreductase [Mycobacteriales bacterium]|nr:TIGR03619 family F420-dependent LLM class oxidoreductase [Mycobacteriales bacterium]